MRLKHPLRLGALLGVSAGALTIPMTLVFPPAERVLDAPARWLADTWHESGIPPHGDAVLMLPFLAWVAQWIIVSVVIGLWLMLRNRGSIDGQDVS